MKKTLLLAVALGLGWAATSQAVVISWAAETSGLVTGYNSARLVYVASGTWNDASWQSYPTVGSLAKGTYSLPSGGVRERSATDITRTDPNGAYFVVLFSDANGTTPLFRSVASLGVGDTAWHAITTDVMNPASGVFTPSGGLGDGWQAIPEPATLSLLGVGAAALALRRRKRLA
jgi:hypothetical protein